MKKNKKLLTFDNCLSRKFNKQIKWLQILKKNSVLTKQTFEKCSLSKPTVIRLLEQFYTHMTKIQKISIPFQVSGFDILGSARTGSGKTLAFLIPMIEFFYSIKWNINNGTGGLILTPTRELSVQNYYVLKDLSKYHRYTYGVIIGGGNKKIEIEKIKKKPTILFATPGRLLDHLRTTKYLKTNNLQFLVIDEADRCLEVGFEEEITSIIRLLPKNRQTILFSATQTKNIYNLAKISFRKDPIYIGTENRKTKNFIQDIEQGFVICQPEDRLALLLALLKKNTKKKIITFFSSCNEVKFFFNLFKKIGLDILELHGKQKQFKRISSFFNFCKAKESTLLCTDIAARGLDIPSIDWIIQFDPPLEPKEYIHRIGRTGRGIHRKGWTLLFLQPTEIGFLKFLKREKIKIKEYNFEKKNFLILNHRIENLIHKNLFLKKLATDAFNSFLKSYKSHRLKDIFDNKKINSFLMKKGFGLI